MVQVENYNHKLTEKKWQKLWADNNTFHLDPNKKREKFKRSNLCRNKQIRIFTINREKNIRKSKTKIRSKRTSNK